MYLIVIIDDKIYINITVKFYDDPSFIKKVLYNEHFFFSKLQANLPALPFKG
jgi:hypothetical protein